MANVAVVGSINMDLVVRASGSRRRERRSWVAGSRPSPAARGRTRPSPRAAWEPR